MGRPVIGITAPTRMTKWGPWDMDATVIPATYALAVMEGGGIPVILPPEDGAIDVISAIDGLVISGGPDINPSMYGAELDPDTLDTYPNQDRREIALIKASIDADLPVLGICRGMQMLNYWSGGKLNKVSNYVGKSHRILPTVNIKNWPRKVECYHKLAISKCPPDFDIKAIYEDGIIAAIKHKFLPWEGWMWHPEREENSIEINSNRLKNLFNK